jgi:hypothetical protein
MKNYLDNLWETLVDYSIATEEELQLVTSINGYNKQTMLDILYSRTGLTSFEQLEEEY